MFLNGTVAPLGNSGSSYARIGAQSFLSVVIDVDGFLSHLLIRKGLSGTEGGHESARTPGPPNFKASSSPTSLVLLRLIPTGSQNFTHKKVECRIHRLESIQVEKSAVPNQFRSNFNQRWARTPKSLRIHFPCGNQWWEHWAAKASAALQLLLEFVGKVRWGIVGGCWWCVRQQRHCWKRETWW